jgi:hypothetical protein
MIDNQEEHHRKSTFQDEYRELWVVVTRTHPKSKFLAAHIPGARGRISIKINDLCQASPV